jgi:hypothetical protein
MLSCGQGNKNRGGYMAKKGMTEHQNKHVVWYLEVAINHHV